MEEKERSFLMLWYKRQEFIENQKRKSKENPEMNKKEQGIRKKAKNRSRREEIQRREEEEHWGQTERNINTKKTSGNQK